MTRHASADHGRNKLLFWGALMSSLIGWAPLLAGLISAGAASAFGCEVNEAYAHPCMVMGADISDALYTGFMSMFFAYLYSADHPDFNHALDHPGRFAHAVAT